MKSSPVKIRKALIVLKRSKYELDLEKYKDLDSLKKICRIQNNCFDKIHSSHLRQLASREFIRKEVFPEGVFVFRKDLGKENLKNYDLIIALGGDNHFTYVSHYAYQNLVMGCNSDSETSVGALLSFTPESLKTAKENNWKNTKIEEWTLISSRIEYPGGTKVETVKAVSEIHIRNNSPDLTSRYLIQNGKILEEQKSSGLLLYTGAGSTGWVNSCIHKINSRNSVFAKTKPFFRAYSRELGARSKARLKLMDFQVKGKLEVVSEMDGGISIDSLDECIYDFPAGAKATFQLSLDKLKVLTIK